MALHDKLYGLRKERGLSQEALAEELGVSRQAISKWESGKAMPESDKLIVISEYFGVSLDYLLRDDVRESGPAAMNETKRRKEKIRDVISVVLIATGALCLVYWGILTVTNPALSDKISESSRITIGGNGIYLMFCAMSVGFGSWLLLKNKDKE